MSRRSNSLYPLLTAILAVMAATPAVGAEISTDFSHSQDVSRTKTSEGSLTDRSNDQEVSLSYSNDFTPLFSTEIEYSFSRSEEEKADSFGSVSTDQSASLDLTAAWWSFSAGWDQAVTRPEDPAEHDEIDTSYEFEITAEPEHELMPDASYAFSRGEEDTAKSYSGAFEYSLLDDSIGISLEAKKDTTKPKNALEDLTDDRSLSASLDYSQSIRDVWKLEASYEHTQDQGLTLDRDLRLLAESHTKTDSLSTQLTYAPLDWIESSLTRDDSWDKDLVVDDPTVKETSVEGELNLTPPVSESLDVETFYTFSTSDKTGTDSDQSTFGQTAGASLTYTMLEDYEFTSSYDWSFDETSPEGEVTTDSRADDISLELTGSVWKDQIEFSASRDYSYAWDDGEKTSETTSWAFALDGTFETFPNLSLTPSFETNEDKDIHAGTKDSDETFTLEIAYETGLGDVVTFALDHSFTRTATYPDSDEMYLKREDSTTISLGFADFLRGMALDIEYSYDASDESGDDLGPDFSYSISYDYSWTILSIYEFTAEHSYDWGPTTDDSKSYGASLSFPLYRDHFDFSFDWTFDTQIEGETNDSESYVIEVSGEF